MLDPRSVAVLGGGMSGLAAAHRLLERAPQSRVTLFDAGDRLGGVVRTERCGEYLLEHGGDMFTTKEPWAVDLCRRLGLEGELLGTNRQCARAFVVRGGRLFSVPEGFTLMTPGRAWPIAKSPLLSVIGKLRMAAEYFVPRRTASEDESLAAFVTRRLGREAFERLVQPLIGGIYTADPTKLSMAAALPQYVAMEREHGGLLRAMRATRQSGETAEATSGARYGLFVAPRNGMQALVDGLARRLPTSAIRLQSLVTSLSRSDDGTWRLRVRGVETAESFDAVVMALPAHCAAELLPPEHADLASELRGIDYASAAIVACGYRRNQIRHPLDGFGVVVPAIEHRRILAASFASVKFPGRAPDDRVLIRVFVGGACQPELAELSDNALEELAQSELAELLGVSGPPELLRVIRWPKAMPQYHVGHLDRVARIEGLVAAMPNFALAGNALRGVGIPFCIHSGELAADAMS